MRSVDENLRIIVSFLHDRFAAEKRNSLHLSHAQIESWFRSCQVFAQKFSKSSCIFFTKIDSGKILFTQICETPQFFGMDIEGKFLRKL